MNVAASRRTWFFDLSLILILVAVFYALWLGSHPLLAPDEGRYSEAAREMAITHDYITPRVNGVAFLDKPILFYWLQTSAIKLFGVNEWAMHFWPALFGLLGCLMTYVAGRLLFDRRTGLIAAGILSTSLLYYLMAHYINLDLEVAVLIDCALFCFIIAVKYLPEKLGHGFLYAAYVASGLAVLTKGLIGFVFPVMMIGVWIIILNRWRLLKQMHIFSGILIVLLINLPWYLLQEHAIPQFFHYFFVKEQFLRFLTADYNNVAPVWFYIPCVLLGLFPWVVFLIQSLQHNIKLVWQNKNQHQTELFLLLWPLIVFIFFSIPSSKTIGYITPIFAPLVLLIACYLNKMWDQKPGCGILTGLWGYIILSSAVIAGIIVLPFLSHWAPKEWHNIIFHLYLVAGILLLGIAVIFQQFRKLTTAKIFWVFLLSMILVLITACAAVSHLNVSNSKYFVSVIKKYEKPGDVIILYDNYYQDMPFYLRNYVIVANDWDNYTIPQSDNWENQLWQGMQFEGSKPWLISFNDFWPLWYSNSQRFFVLFDKAIYENFAILSSGRFRVLAVNGDTYLVSNE